MVLTIYLVMSVFYQGQIASVGVFPFPLSGALWWVSQRLVPALSLCLLPQTSPSLADSSLKYVNPSHGPSPTHPGHSPPAGTVFGVLGSGNHAPGIQGGPFSTWWVKTSAHKQTVLPWSRIWTAALRWRLNQGQIRETHCLCSPVPLMWKVLFQVQASWPFVPGKLHVLCFCLTWKRFWLLSRLFFLAQSALKVVLFSPECMKCYRLACPHFYLSVLDHFTYKVRGIFLWEHP